MLDIKKIIAIVSLSLFTLIANAAVMYDHGGQYLSRHDLLSKHFYHHPELDHSRIQEPEHVASSPRSAEPTEPETSHPIIYSLKKKPKNLLGGTLRQAQQLKRFLGKNY